MLREDGLRCVLPPQFVDNKYYQLHNRKAIVKSEYLLLSNNLSSCPLRFLTKGNDLTVVMLFINSW